MLFCYIIIVVRLENFRDKHYTYGMRHNKKGFTIIEVILVLGIAALIILTVFLVVPSLWASQRDAERKTKMTDYIAALKEYQTNNSRGALPVNNIDNPVTFTTTDATGSDRTNKNTWEAFVRDYMDNNFYDPDGRNFVYYIVKCAKINPDDTAGTASTGQPCEYSARAYGLDEGMNHYTITGLKTANGDDFSTGGGVNHTIYTVVGATCDGDKAVKSSNARNVAVIYLMERAGRFCAST